MSIENRLAVALLLALATGCGKKETGALSGRVTFEGRPVVSGQVAVTPADGVPRRSVIGPDGSYVVTDIPLGSAFVTVVSPDPAQMDGDPEKPPLPDAVRPPGWFPIPERFADRRNSDLTRDVLPGSQTYNIELR